MADVFLRVDGQPGRHAGGFSIFYRPDGDQGLGNLARLVTVDVFMALQIAGRRVFCAENG